MYYPRHVSSINMPIFRRTNCIHTASGIVALCKLLQNTPVESRLCRAESALYRCTVQPFTESDDTRCCVNTICPPEDGHVNARNMSRIVHLLMNKNCALKLVNEIILYYDARSKKHKKNMCSVWQSPYFYRTRIFVSMYPETSFRGLSLTTCVQISSNITSTRRSLILSSHLHFTEGSMKAILDTKLWMKQGRKFTIT